MSLTREPIGARVLMWVMDFSDARITQNGLPIWDDLWGAIYQRAARTHFRRYPYLWTMAGEDK